MTHSTQPRPIRVLLVDDHETMLWGLERLIQSEGPRMVVAAKAATAAEAVRLVAQTQPDIILLDLDLGEDRGLDVLPELLRSAARVVIVTGIRDQSQLDKAVLAGARGVVSKGQPPINIIRAIEKVYAGELWLDRSATGRIFVELSRRTVAGDAPEEQRKIARLTPRERDIVRTLAREPGLSIVQIAQKQNISERTLRNHLTSIYGKLGVSSRLELNVYAGKHRLD